MMQVVEIILARDKDLFILHSQYNGCWWPGDVWCLSISSCGIDLVFYYQTPNKRRTLVGNKIVDHSICSWSIACHRCSKYIFIFYLTPGFNGLGKGNCKTRGEKLNFFGFGVTCIKRFYGSNILVSTQQSYLFNLLCRGMIWNIKIK